MDVLFVCSWFPSRLHATAGNFIERHLEAVRGQGHRIMVLHLGLSNRVVFPHVSREDGDRDHIFHLFLPRLLASEKVLHFFAKRILSKLRGEGFLPEVIHGHVLFPAGQLAVIISRLTGKPLVYTEHWTAFNTFNAKELPLEVLHQAKAVAEETSCFMPVSNDLAISMQQLGLKGNYEVVYNAVDTSHFYVDREKQNSEFTFLHISNFLPVKNVVGIMDAFDYMHRQAPVPVRLIIAGDGDLKPLKEYASGLAAGPYIKFAGQMSYTAVAARMRQADGFILFSDYENLPCVIAESLCCGVPVIATKVGGIPEMVNSENGILITPGEIAELSHAMLSLLKDSHFDAEQISKSAAGKYSYEAVGSQYSKIYQMVRQAGYHGI